MWLRRLMVSTDGTNCGITWRRDWLLRTLLFCFFKKHKLNLQFKQIKKYIYWKSQIAMEKKPQNLKTTGTRNLNASKAFCLLTAYYFSFSQTCHTWLGHTATGNSCLHPTPPCTSQFCHKKKKIRLKLPTSSFQGWSQLQSPQRRLKPPPVRSGALDGGVSLEAPVWTRCLEWERSDFPQEERWCFQKQGKVLSPQSSKCSQKLRRLAERWSFCHSLMKVTLS